MPQTDIARGNLTPPLASFINPPPLEVSHCNILHTELLIDILLASGPPDDEDEDFGRLHSLALVCVRWWNVIKDTPDFWVNVHSGDNSHAVFKVKRSGMLPISVFYHATTSLDTPEPEENVRPFLEIVWPSANRWKRLDIDAPDAVELFRPYLVGPTPLLTTINLCRA